MEGCFELSIGNADKGMLPLLEVQRRVEQFVTARLPVVITQVLVQHNGLHSLHNVACIPCMPVISGFHTVIQN